MITKEGLKEFLKGRYDTRFEEIIKELKISKEDIPKVKEFLEELEKEKWVRKSKCSDGEYEWDPEIEQNLG